MSSDPPLLELQDAARAFGAGDSRVRALNGISLQVRAGTSLAITGRSGSGKSTLLNVLGLLESLTGGRYLLNGRDTGALPAREIDELRASTFGFVFQAFHLVPYLTVAENVELGLTYRRRPRRERTHHIDALLEQVGLTHRRDMAVTTLSGGEKQRAAIARALVRRPLVLLADEPTGNLDDASAADVLRLFDAIVAGGVALVMVTHDLSTAARAGQQIHLRDGRVQP
ncbi:ABC transporter ATP-binding protein [Cellulomonas soli]|uniref:ABC transporter ATP-binding protein n=1 Tax=Cellulomonas soli TaxID=931535 RepID=A0A512PEK5_9CELL|nr:ABC transporter ATP-binding protein [Cellulomonas soli]NYI58891.1 putative ABC transport system ATP-binding protein [Cellulomonas soli]GEP69616.1 ABC transporter ATP-binding protein [Cellulomonas soli]